MFNTLKVKLNEKLNQFELVSKNKYKYFCVRMIPVEKKGVVRKAFFSSIAKNKHIDVHTIVFV